MLDYKFDTQLLIEGHGLSEEKISEFIAQNIEGDSLIAVGDEDLIKIHFHTNAPWKVLEYCATLGDIYDIVVENMERQEKGLHG
jgi:dihydroxyacetone kinase-like predicted kinase